MIYKVEPFFICCQDDRFNHDIDVRTGYKTRTLLCMPIKDCNGDVIGVAQVNRLIDDCYQNMAVVYTMIMS